VSDAGVARLDALAKLTRLDLSKTRVSDAGIRSLVNYFSALENLQVSETRLSAKGFSVLKAAFPNAAIQWSEPNRTAALALMAAGGTVRVRPNGAAEDRAVKSAAELPEDYFKVTAVGLVSPATLPAGLVEKLAALHDPTFDGLAALEVGGDGLNAETLGALLRGLPRSVVDLSLARTGAGDALLSQCAKDLAALRRLDLSGCPIVGRGLGALKGLAELRELKLGCPTLTDLFAPELASLAGLKHLEKLSLAGSGVGDEGLKQLTGLNNLCELDLTGTKVTQEGVAALKKALPACQIRP
jgi:hypothetical protein